MVNEQTLIRFPLLQYFLTKSEEGGYEYMLWPSLMMTGLGVFLIYYFWNYRYELDAKQSQQELPATLDLQLSGGTKVDGRK